MYEDASKECLINGERLLEDAKLLLSNGSYGTAQSLGVTALEEIGKSIILELADLNYVGTDIVERSMRDHRPKQIITQVIEKGLLLPDKIDRRNETCRINNEELTNLAERLRKDTRSLDHRRQEGLYVQIRTRDGVNEKSPQNIDKTEVENFLTIVTNSVNFGKNLSEIIYQFKNPEPEVNQRNNLWMFQNDSGFTFQWDDV